MEQPLSVKVKPSQIEQKKVSPAPIKANAGKIEGGNLKDSKGRVNLLGNTTAFDVYDSEAKPKKLKLDLMKGLLRGYSIANEGEKGVYVKGQELPVFYFRIHDVPGYKPEWKYDSGGISFETRGYGKVNIISFETPTGHQPIDVRVDSGNKIIIERAFTIDAVIDESQLAEGYHIEYRQYIKGGMKYGNTPILHTLYNGNLLSEDDLHEDGNGKATPYGRRNKSSVVHNEKDGIGAFTYKEYAKVDSYMIPLQSDGKPVSTSIHYQAVDFPGFILKMTDEGKPEVGSIDVTFEGKLVIVKDGSDEVLMECISRNWSFKGRIKNLGKGKYERG